MRWFLALAIIVFLVNNSYADSDTLRILQFLNFDDYKRDRDPSSTLSNKGQQLGSDIEQTNERFYQGQKLSSDTKPTNRRVTQAKMSAQYRDSSNGPMRFYQAQKQGRQLRSQSEVSEDPTNMYFSQGQMSDQDRDSSNMRFYETEQDGRLWSDSDPTELRFAQSQLSEDKPNTSFDQGQRSDQDIDSILMIFAQSETSDQDIDPTSSTPQSPKLDQDINPKYTRFAQSQVPDQDIDLTNTLSALDQAFGQDIDPTNIRLAQSHVFDQDIDPNNMRYTQNQMSAHDINPTNVRFYLDQNQGPQSASDSQPIKMRYYKDQDLEANSEPIKMRYYRDQDLEANTVPIKMRYYKDQQSGPDSEPIIKMTYYEVQQSEADSEPIKMRYYTDQQSGADTEPTKTRYYKGQPLEGVRDPTSMRVYQGKSSDEAIIILINQGSSPRMFSKHNKYHVYQDQSLGLHTNTPQRRIIIKNRQMTRPITSSQQVEEHLSPNWEEAEQNLQERLGKISRNAGNQWSQGLVQIEDQGDVLERIYNAQRSSGQLSFDPERDYQEERMDINKKNRNKIQQSQIKWGNFNDGQWRSVGPSGVHVPLQTNEHNLFARTPYKMVWVTEN